MESGGRESGNCMLHTVHTKKYNNLHLKGSNKIQDVVSLTSKLYNTIFHNKPYVPLFIRLINCWIFAMTPTFVSYVIEFSQSDWNRKSNCKDVIHSISFYISKQKIYRKNIPFNQIKSRKKNQHQKRNEMVTIKHKRVIEATACRLLLKLKLIKRPAFIWIGSFFHFFGGESLVFLLRKRNLLASD